MKTSRLKNLSEILYNRYSNFAVIIIIYSIIVYILLPSKYYLKPGNFFSIALISYLFWTGLGYIIRQLNKPLRLVFTFIISFFLVVLMVSGYQLFDEFQQFLSIGLLDFLKQNPVYLNTYINQTLHRFSLMFFLLILSILLCCITRIDKQEKSISVKQNLFGFLILILAIGGIIISKHEYQRSYIPADLHTFYAFYFHNPDNQDLKPFQHIVNYKALQLPDDKRKIDEKYNVVLIVFESLSRIPLSFYGFNNSFTPFMHKWINKEKENFVIVKNAMSVSGATDASMPALYTGVGPEQAYYKLSNAPFLWDYAKLNGYNTIIATSQSQEWKNLKHFIKDENLDYYFYPEILNLPLINDVGADDLSVIEKIKNILLKIKNPFFFYYNTNATHGPYQDYSPLLQDFNGIKNRYGKALYLTDKSVEKIYEIIKKRKDLDKTFFIFLADHGDYAVKRRQRLSSFFKETLDIPMMIRVPEKWKKSHLQEFEQLKKNASNTRITNLDITPTIYQIIFDKYPENNSFFEGKSLFGPIDNDRVTIALSTNDTRHYDTEGFGIYKGNESFIFHDNTGFHFYDLKTDSLQQNDLINTLPPEKRAFYDSIYMNNRYMKAVFERHKNDF
jgi:hypothetical protein